MDMPVIPVRVHLIKPFKCGICRKLFFFQEELQTHLMLHARKKLFKCEVCGKALASHKNLSEHMLLHSDNRPFKCKRCSAVFVQRDSLRKHRCGAAKKNHYECNICKEPFVRLCFLKEHLRIHGNTGDFKCEICGKGFAGKGRLKLHLLMHKKEWPHRCEICNRTFSRKSGLLHHKHTHPSEQLCRCQTCGETFLPNPCPENLADDDTKLGIFVRSILEDHSYFTFANGESAQNFIKEEKAEYHSLACLEDHNYTFVSLRKYRCDKCDEVFQTNPTLEDHSYMDVRTSRTYKCATCSKKFTNYLKFLSHVEFHSKKVVSDASDVRLRLAGDAGRVPQFRIGFMLDVISMYL